MSDEHNDFWPRIDFWQKLSVTFEDRMAPAQAYPDHDIRVTTRSIAQPSQQDVGGPEHMRYK